MAPTRICVVGSLNVDFVTYTPRCPGPGETLTATSLAILAGGKGANQAVACGRASFVSDTQQDVAVCMIGAVGADDAQYATLLRPALQDSGVQTSGIDERPHSRTGSATIVVEEDGQNRIMVVPGANHSGMLDSEKILISIVQQMGANCTDSAHDSAAAGIVVLQGELPRDTTLSLLRHLNSASAVAAHVVFNPAPVFPAGIPLDAMVGTSVLVVNETEAVQLSASMQPHRSCTLTGSNSDDLRPEELVPYFHNTAGIIIVLITLGSKGVFYSTVTGSQGLVPGVDVENVVDTTAAGDTFVGYFSAAFAKFVATGADLATFDARIEQVVRRANAAAAVCVQRKGAMQSIPFAYEHEDTKSIS